MNTKNITLEKVFFIAAVSSYLLAFYYLSSGMSLALFSLFFVIWVETITHLSKISPSKESWFWMSVTVLNAFAYEFQRHSYDVLDLELLFTHISAIYYILVRTHALTESTTSNHLLYDCFNGIILIPFRNFSVFFQSIKCGLKDSGHHKIIEIVLTFFITLIVLFSTYVLLSDVDPNFAKLGILLHESIRYSFDFYHLFQFIFAFPVAMYFSGLLLGSIMQKKNDRKAKKYIPFWSIRIILSALLILYVIFFISSSYTYISSVGNILHPEISASDASSFAVNGFYNLLVILQFNFLLTYIFYAHTEYSSQKLIRILASFSILFVILAFLKLFVYIAVFGITVRRYYAAWYLGILTINALLVLRYTFHHYPVMRTAFVISVILFTILVLLPNETMIRNSALLSKTEVGIIQRECISVMNDVSLL